MAKKDWMVRTSELDEDQIRILMATLDKSCVVSGCAGSGKSVLALIKAQRIQRERGDDYQIIVFTKTLCKYMNAGRESLGLNNQFAYHWDWVNRQYCPNSNYVIVDEIQDFTKEEIQEFIQATRKNFFFFGDTAQSIYEGLKTTCSVEDIRELFAQGEKPKYFELFRNYRLPLPVARIVQYVGVDLDGFDENTYKSKETAMPKFIQYDNLDEQIDAIVRILNNNRALKDVGILLPHNDDIKEIHESLNRRGLTHEVRYNDKERRMSVDTLDFNTNNPKLTTYHSAKGLQFQTVFLPKVQDCTNGDEDLEKGHRKSLYVAMTRTYRDLYIMYSGELPFPLDQIPANLYATKEIEEIRTF